MYKIIKIFYNDKTVNQKIFNRTFIIIIIKNENTNTKGGKYNSKNKNILEITNNYWNFEYVQTFLL